MDQPDTLHQPDSDTPETPDTVLQSPGEAVETPKRKVSEARLRANRENAKSSTGPRSDEGKARSSLNATRHGILSQVIHLPQEEMAAYDEFTCEYVTGLSPVGPVETQLANACADLQFRLHRLSAAEHNLFAIGHDENGGLWNTSHSESHTALTLAETLRRSKDPLGTLTTYEQRLSRRFLQTLKQLREIQAERRLEEKQQLAEMLRIASRHPEDAAALEPAQLGFVCSTRDWKFFYKRAMLLDTNARPTNQPKKHSNGRKFRREAA